MNDEHIQAWHFVRNDGTTGNGSIPVIAGETLSIPGDETLVICKHGLHWSLRAVDALKFAPGAMVCRVEAWGDIQRQDDKGVSRYRKCLWMADATRTLHEFALWCAEQALVLVSDPDPQSLAALEVKRRWLDGQATDEELAAAEAAAWAAARAAAGDAARAAARAAAWAAAWAAAEAAARNAAEAAARNAAWEAAWEAARDKQNAKIEAMLMTLEPKGKTG